MNGRILTQGTVDAYDLGFGHGVVSGETIGHERVRQTFQCWTDAEVDAYLEGRIDGVIASLQSEEGERL